MKYLLAMTLALPERLRHGSGRTGPAVLALVAAALGLGCATGPAVQVPPAAASNGSAVIVLGHVARPGSVPYVPGMRVSDAINACGGRTDLAWDGPILTRTTTRGRERFRLLFSLGKVEPDVELSAGDEVFQPASD